MPMVAPKPLPPQTVDVAERLQIRLTDWILHNLKPKLEVIIQFCIRVALLDAELFINQPSFQLSNQRRSETPNREDQPSVQPRLGGLGHDMLGRMVDEYFHALRTVDSPLNGDSTYTSLDPELIGAIKNALLSDDCLLILWHLLRKPDFPEEKVPQALNEYFGRVIADSLDTRAAFREWLNSVCSKVFPTALYGWKYWRKHVGKKRSDEDPSATGSISLSVATGSTSGSLQTSNAKAFVSSTVVSSPSVLHEPPRPQSFSTSPRHGITLGSKRRHPSSARKQEVDSSTLEDDSSYDTQSSPKPRKRAKTKAAENSEARIVKAGPLTMVASTSKFGANAGGALFSPSATPTIGQDRQTNRLHVHPGDAAMLTCDVLYWLYRPRKPSNDPGTIALPPLPGMSDEKLLKRLLDIISLYRLGNNFTKDKDPGSAQILLQAATKLVCDNQLQGLLIIPLPPLPSVQQLLGPVEAGEPSVPAKHRRSQYRNWQSGQNRCLEEPSNRP